MVRLNVEVLTAEGFRPFGQVLDTTGAVPITINEGFARRWNDLSVVDVEHGDGRAQVCLFEAEPRPLPVRIDMMERHPLGTQMFFPLQDRSWLVVVCSDPDRPASFRAFRATGQQGVSYARNVWHHPLLVLDRGSRFIVVDRAGPGNNLEEQRLKTSLELQLAGQGGAL